MVNVMLPPLLPSQNASNRLHKEEFAKKEVEFYGTLEKRMLEHGVFAPVFRVQGTDGFEYGLRVSAQIFLELKDFEVLGRAILTIFSRPFSYSPL